MEKLVKYTQNMWETIKNKLKEFEHFLLVF